MSTQSPWQAAVEMYTTSGCIYCVRARHLLDRKRVMYVEHDVTGKPALRADLVQRTGRKTVPQIFINGQSVGGFDDLAALDAEGALDNLLRQPPPSNR